jgi:diaminopimelate decarboxylase
MGGCIFGDKPGAPSFDEYAKTIVDVMKSFDIDRSVNLIMEPGAALVASPFSYVCKVLGTKDIKDVRLVFTDGSVKQIAPQMNPVKFMSTFTASKENRIDRQVVSGYSCIENDRFLELNGERELSVGDIIELKNTGAYSMVLSPLFIEYYPHVYVKDGEEIIVARKKWETSEFIQKSNLCK